MGLSTRLPAPAGHLLQEPPAAQKESPPLTSREVKLNSPNPSDAGNPDSAAHHPPRCLSSTDTSAPDLKDYALLLHRVCTHSETPWA